MRMTSNTLYRNTLIDLNTTADQMALYQQQVSSGKRISKASDDPQGAATAVSDHAEIGNLDRYANAADTSVSRLTAVDSALSDIVSQLTAAKTAATAGRGSGLTSTQRQAYVNQLQGIKEALVSDLNSSFKNSYLFSGTTTSAQPFTVTAGTVSAYQGNATAQSIDVDRQIAIPVTFDGSSITQGSDAQDVFTTLDQLMTAVQNGDGPGVSTGMDGLDRAIQRTGQVQTGVGVSLNRLDDQRSRLTTTKQAITTRLSSLEDANLAEAITGLQTAQTAQQATFGAAASLNQQTLMDFIR